LNIFGRNSSVVINGKTYVGNNISINNNEVIIDGVRQDGVEDKKMEVTILCNVDKIVSNESINIKGNVNGNVEAKVNVNCDDIKGNVKAGVNINCDDINGSAIAGTVINCDNISGNATASKVNR
jgi:hypothetical protein